MAVQGSYAWIAFNDEDAPSNFFSNTLQDRKQLKYSLKTV
jgi:hypothetical protein